MDVRVSDGRVEPLFARVKAAWKPMEGEISPWPQDDLGSFLADDLGSFLAFSQAEVDAMLALDPKAQVFPEPQPDPTLLAALQGKVSSRSEALACLAAGKVPVTIQDLDQRMRAVETRAIR